MSPQSRQQDTQGILESIRRKFPQMPSQQKKIGMFLLEHPEVLGLISLAELAARAEASHSTIIRFCRTLGYKGFLDFSRSAQRMVEKALSHAGCFREALDAERSAQLQRFSKSIVETDLVNLTRLSENFPTNSITTTVERMLEARKISILGCMSAYPLAVYFEQLLAKITDKVDRVSNAEMIQASMVARMNQGHLFFCIAFPRYPRTIVQLAAIAKTRGATVIGITNNTLSPIAGYSDILFQVPVKIVSYIDLVTPVLPLINVICTEFGHAQHELTEQHLHAYDAIVTDVYF